MDDKVIAITFLQNIFDQIVEILIMEEDTYIQNYKVLTNGLQMVNKIFYNMYTSFMSKSWLTCCQNVKSQTFLDW